MSDYIAEQNAIKLDMLGSLARSQRALARLLEYAADAAEDAGPLRQELCRNIEAIVSCQRALAAHIGAVRIRRIARGKPGAVWLAPRACPGSS